MGREFGSLPRAVFVGPVFEVLHHIRKTHALFGEGWVMYTLLYDFGDGVQTLF
jgi:hypothetical protein